jgi:anaerobic selenocysteine-containing dehydrogenase
MAAQIKTYHGACPHDCPDTCAFVYTVENGRLISVKGNADHPMTNGGLCVKLKDYDEHHYNADRVLFPLKRNSPKGSRQYVRISWDQALAEIKQRWTETIDQYGAQAILPLSYLGNQGLVQGITAGDAFFNRLGATVCEKTFCASGSSTAWLLTVGPTGGVDPESFVHAKYIVIWACNTLSTNLHHWPFIRRAQEQGAKIVVIDAFKSRTAKMADWHLSPKPGTDGALAMAWVNVLITENLIDQDYVAKYTVGFEQLKERALQCTPEWAAAITGVAAEDVRQLAREYAKTQPAAIRVGVALERSAGGADAIRLAAILPALVGAWRHVGGGTLEMPVWEMPIYWDRVCRPDYIPKGTRVVNILQTGRTLNGEMKLDPPVKSLFVYNTNPVTQAPETDKIIAGLKREDLFTVVAEHFISDTASYADIILPAAMAAEMEDMVWSWGHFYLTYNQLIAYAEVTNDGNDRQQLQAMALATQAEALTVIADTGYANGQQGRHGAEHGITALGPRPEGVTPKGKTYFTRDRFAYDATTDTYRCPAGETLRRHRTSQTHHSQHYGTSGCGDCALKAHGTAGRHRVIVRSFCRRRHAGHAPAGRARARVDAPAPLSGRASVWDPEVDAGCATISGART